MKILDVKQHSDEWYKMRKTMIGASDAPVIVGKSPYSTPSKLWRLKMGLDEQYVSDAMKSGTELESEAVSYFHSLFNIGDYNPVVQSTEEEFMFASLDNARAHEGEIVEFREIKCPQANTLRKVAEGEIPEYWIWQVQHQLAVTGLDHAVIWVYNAYLEDLERFYEFKIERDEDKIKEIVKKGKEFHQHLIDEIPIDPEKDPAVIREDKDWLEAVDAWKKAKKQLDDAKELEAITREGIIYLANDKSSAGGGVSVTKTERKGTVDYKKIPELKGVNLEEYRKPSYVSWRFTQETESVA